MACDFVERELWAGYSLEDVMALLGEPTTVWHTQSWTLDNPRTLGDGDINRDVNSSLIALMLGDTLFSLDAANWNVHPLQRPFDSAAWRHSTATERTAMVDSLLATFERESWDAARLAAELGPPDKTEVHELAYEMSHSSLILEVRHSRVEVALVRSNS